MHPRDEAHGHAPRTVNRPALCVYWWWLQVTCAANQLDAVAQLLQQTRTQLQSAADGGQQQHLGMQVVPGLLPEPEALDELLFHSHNP